MSKKLSKKPTKEQQAHLMQDELQRAHIIIVILAVSLAFLLFISLVQPLQFDIVLGSIVASLLVLVAGASLFSAIRLGKYTKK